MGMDLVPVYDDGKQDRKEGIKISPAVQNNLGVKTAIVKKTNLSLIIDNKSHFVESAPVKMEEGKYYATINGRRYDVDVLDERLVATRQAGEVIKDMGAYVILSPMPGLIVDVRVKVGDSVKAGAAVVVMEAMKMQNELVSEVDGIVKAINIKAKDAVDSQQALIEIEKAGEGSE